MHRYAETLIGDCPIEDLLKGTPFDEYAGCYMIRVKGDCHKDDWESLPDLMDEAMEDTVSAYASRDVLEVKSNVSGRGQARLYDTLQVTPNGCTCRVYVGGARLHKIKTSSPATTATHKMDKMRMAKFKPTLQQWDKTQPGYHAIAFHLVLHTYQRNDGIDAHQDISELYDSRHPIISLSYGRGSILTIQYSNRPEKKQTGLYYQFFGDALIMPGAFNLTFLHGVPAVDSWEALFQTQNIVRNLQQHEFDEANKVIHGDENEIYNVTIRWHESHHPTCPYLCVLAAQLVVPQAAARTMRVDWDTPDAPCLLGSAPVRYMPGMAAVNKIVGPIAPPSPPPQPPPVAKSGAAMQAQAPPQKPQSDQPSTSFSACAEPNEKAAESHRVDIEQATVTKAALLRLFTDVSMGVPDWTDCSAALPLLPSRASQKRDYDVLKPLR